MERQPTATEGVVTDITYSEMSEGELAAAGIAPRSRADELPLPGEEPVAPPPATTSGSGGTYVVNNGGDPRTWRTVELDDEGNAAGARIGRIVVRDDGALALEYLEQQAAAELNAAEIALLERRLAEAKGEL